MEEVGLGLDLPTPVLHHVDGRMLMRTLPGEVGGGSVMLWAIFCFETLGPAIHVNVTLYHLPKHCYRPCTCLH